MPGPPVLMPIAKAFQKSKADALLRGMADRSIRERWQSNKFRARLPAEAAETFAPQSFMHAMHCAEDEVDALGDHGLTVAFKEVKVLDDSDDIFAGSGEIYVITSLFDGSGQQPDFKTKLFEGISSGDNLPLGGGGMLVGMLKNPRWFVDMHMLVMESDSDIRKVGSAIEKARKDSGLSDMLKTVGGLASFDPMAISRVTGAVDVFLGLLSGLLKANADDHVATVHDFYLKSQAFGAGLHPSSGLQRFQQIEVAYEIALQKL